MGEKEEGGVRDTDRETQRHTHRERENQRDIQHTHTLTHTYLSLSALCSDVILRHHRF